jgi:flagellar assembly factor FliW
MSSSVLGASVVEQPLLTTRFGPLTSYQPYRFTHTLLGFEQYTRFALLPQLSGFPLESPLLWLQSMEEPGLAFVLTQPPLFNLEHIVTVPDDCLLALELDPATVTPEALTVYTLVTILDGQAETATTNLLAPLIFAPQQGTAVQWVLNDPQYHTRVPLLAQTDRS